MKKLKYWVKRSTLAALILSLILVGSTAPVFASDSTYVDVEGAYTVTCNIPERVIDNTMAVTRARTGTLTITTETDLGVISSASLTITGIGTVAVTGYVGTGTNPRIALVGSAGGINVVISGRVILSGDAVSQISATIDGFTATSDAVFGSDESGTAAGSVVDQKTGAQSALLTQAAGAGSTYVQWTPKTGIRLRDLDSIDPAEWGLWFNLQDTKAGGPQLELRFTANSTVTDGAGHVDVTLLTPTTGNATWTHRTYDSTFPAMYYGNDPEDGTAFSDDTPETVATIVESINNEAVMAGYDASNWRLSRVKVELWDAGIRTCYVDDVMINGRVNSFEPMQFSGKFTAKPSA